MAEGDSILRVAKGIDRALAGSPLTVRAPGPRRPAGGRPEDLDGLVLERAESRGKHLLLHFSGGKALHSHLGMKGSWHLYRAGERWRMPRARAWIALSDATTEAVNFGGSTLRIVTEAQLRRDPRLARLGPDLLGADFDPAVGAAALRRGGDGTELGETLLDQSLVAGIGNIYKSEGCFEVGLSPWRPLATLDDGDLQVVIAETRRLMLEAADSGRMPHRVYRRPGSPCPRCGTAIRSHPQGDSARMTYWCPACQPGG